METFFTTTEFYVIAITIAVAVIALVARPSQRGEAFSYIFTARLIPATSDTPKLYIEAMDNGKLKILHRGASASDNTRISISLTIIGKDIKIVEKPYPEVYDEGAPCDAEYIVDCLKSDRYHLYFDSPAMGIYAASSLRNTPPFHVELPFSQ